MVFWITDPHRSLGSYELRWQRLIRVWVRMNPDDGSEEQIVAIFWRMRKRGTMREGGEKVVGHEMRK